MPRHGGAACAGVRRPAAAARAKATQAAHQRERPGEHRRLAEHPPLVSPSSRVTPLHRQRPVPPRRQPVPARQQTRTRHRARPRAAPPQRLHPRRRQLNRQRHPVQPRHHWPGLARQGNIAHRPGVPGPRTASPPRTRPPGHCDRARASGPSRNRASPASAAAPGWSPAPARHHTRPAAPRTAPPLRRSDARSYQHQQQLPAGPAPAPAPRPPGAPGCSCSPAPRRPPPTTCAGSWPGQLGQPRPSANRAATPRAAAAGQPGLAHPTRPGHRHQPVQPEQVSHLAHLLVPANEAGQLGRKAMHATGGGFRPRIPHARTITAGRIYRTGRSGGRTTGTQRKRHSVSPLPAFAGGSGRTWD